ncbi:NAD(+)/NADH kinase, partial [Acinetobacter baumannii]|nr:NAD(+)/NADH kinase [Acinetobacter baumannii]
YNTPVIGINRGRLGFLTDIKPSEAIFKLDQVLQGHFQLDRRFLLVVKTVRDSELLAEWLNHHGIKAACYYGGADD